MLAISTVRALLDHDVLLVEVLNIAAGKRRTSIGTDAENSVETIEHLMAALWAAEIDDITVEMDASEPPAMDGCSLAFLKALGKAGKKALTLSEIEI